MKEGKVDGKASIFLPSDANETGGAMIFPVKINLLTTQGNRIHKYTVKSLILDAPKIKT